MFALALVWGAFGTIVGSFANVVILRYGTRSISGRSACACGHMLVWWELVPILSFIALRGKCRECKGAISWQYPLVEIAMGLLFLGVGFLDAPFYLKVLSCVILFLLVCIFVYDLRYLLMPNVWVYSFAMLALTYAFLSLEAYSFSAIVSALLAGPLVALPLFFLWFVSRGAWMGFGDVKFAPGMGWLLGIEYGLYALMISFFLGAFVGVFILLPWPRIVAFIHSVGITRLRSSDAGYTMKSEVPFGPFLILGLCIMWFLSMYEIPLPALW
jgi:prepilin signal peptidase PulO-like enzyme (type II secretory pathway)